MKPLAEVCKNDAGQVYLKFFDGLQLNDLVDVTLYGYTGPPAPVKPFAWISGDAIRAYETYTGCVERSTCNMRFGLYNTPLYRHPAPKIHGYDVFCTHEGRVLRIQGYTGSTENAVKQHILFGARKEGYNGTVEDRMQELGWRIQPIFSY